MKRNFLAILSSAACLLFFCNGASGWESSILHRDASGNRLVYHSDPAGNRIMNFSYAGYHNGEVALPNVPVVHTIGPVAGDNTANIQAGINHVASLPPNSNGHRGALLLRPGTYPLLGEVRIAVGGVVVRGSGQGGNPAVDTIIRPTGAVKRRTIVVGTDVWNGWNNQVTGSRKDITSEFIPAGSRTLKVANASGYKVGDNVIIKQPATDAWLSAVNFGDTAGDPLWGTDVGLAFNRFVTRIEGNLIEVDVPIYHDLDRSLSQSYMYVYDRSTIIEECGVEKLRIDIETAGEFDDNHAESGVSLVGTEDCWVKNVTVVHYSEYGVSMQQCTRTTVLDCNAIEPHSVITGGKRSAFMANDACNNILFKGCYGSKGRHIFVTNGGASHSGVVFTQCIGHNAYTSSESHRRWGCAVLWDQIQFTSPLTSDYVLGIGYNRGNWGTGHGWTGTGMVGWNVTANHIVVQKSPIGQNFAIGCKATVDNRGPWVHPVGFIEGTGQTPANIPSLYEAQLAERLTYGIAPGTPAKLRMSHYSSTGTRFAVLEWIDTALDENGFVLERSSNGGGSYSVLANLPANRVSYTDTTVAQNGSYIYRLYATNAIGASAYGNPLPVNLAAPELPEAITVQAENYTGISGSEMQRSPHLGYTDGGPAVSIAANTTGTTTTVTATASVEIERLFLRAGVSRDVSVEDW